MPRYIPITPLYKFEPTFISPFSMSLPHFIAYLTHEKNYARHTILAYRKDLQNFSLFIEEKFQEENLSTVNYSQIRSWIVKLVNDGNANRTINRKITSLKSYYTYLLKIKEIEASPLAQHKALKTGQKIQLPFSKKEVEEILALIAPIDFESARNSLIIELFYTTGIRRAELIHIPLSAIDLQNKQIKILGKRNKERILPLLTTTTKSINTYLRYREALAIKNKVDYLFISKKGVKLNESLVYRVINNYFSQVSGKVKKSPHILRHSFATHLLDEGASLNTVKELLGHASLASTQVYTHNSIATLKKTHAQAHPRNKTNLKK